MDVKGLIAAVGILALAGSWPAAAQTLAWQSQITTQVPVGAGLTVANVAHSSPSTSPVVALATFMSGTSTRYQYRAIAVDPEDGSQLWSTDLGKSCETRSTAYSLVVPLPGGDVIVTAQGSDQLNPTYVTFTCVLRLSAVDGHMVWSSTHHAAGGKLELYAAHIDGAGDVVVTGRKNNDAISMRLDAADGQMIWEHLIPAEAGRTLRGFSAVSGSNDSTVIHLQSESSIEPDTFKLIGISTSSGSERWSMSHCSEGAYAVFQRNSDHVGLRMLVDNTFEYVSSCRADADSAVEIGRMNALTGAVIWTRNLTQSGLRNSGIDADGSMYIKGELSIDGLDLEMAKLDAADGSVEWSLPQPPTQPTMDPYISSQIVVSNAYVHVLEKLIGSPDYVTSSTMATYAANSGQFLGRVDVDLPPSQELVVPRWANLATFGNGEVLVAATSGQNRYVGSRLSVSRLQALTGLASWARQIPIMAPHPMVPLYAYQTTRQMLWNEKGGAGVLFSGAGVNPADYDYPRIAKLAASDGHVLWRWEPDKRVRGNIAAALNDAEGNVIVAGTNGWDDPAMLLAKLDGADGNVIWESSAGPQRPALDATLDANGAALLLLGQDVDESGPSIRIAKFSVSDGSAQWEVPMPDGWDRDIGEQRVAVNVDGSVLATSVYANSDYSETGLQVAKFRATNGALRWRTKLPGITSSSVSTAFLVSLSDGDLVVATQEIVWRVDGVTGNVEWQKSLPSWTWSVIQDAQGGIVAGGELGGHRHVTKFDASSGSILWALELPQDIAAPSSELVTALALSSDGDILVVGAGGGQSGRNVVAKLSTVDGATIWELAMAPGSAVDSVSQPMGFPNYPAGILESPDGNIYYSGLADMDSTTWTLSRVTGAFADGIFASGFD